RGSVTNAISGSRAAKMLRGAASAVARKRRRCIPELYRQYGQGCLYKLDRTRRTGQRVPAVFSKSASVNQLERKLDLARRKGRGDLSAARGVIMLVQAVAAEVRVIRNIEELPAELELGPLVDFEVLENGQVHAPQAGRVDDVAPRVAERARRRCREGVFVEPVCRVLVARIDWDSGHTIRPVLAV